MAGVLPIPNTGSKKPNSAKLGIVWNTAVIPMTNSAIFFNLEMKIPSGTEIRIPIRMETNDKYKCSCIAVQIVGHLKMNVSMNLVQSKGVPPS